VGCSVAAYYNEVDPFAAAWLRRLIARGLIAPGDVDERSIADVRATDLVSYDQCHFFAGIGGWSLALRLAGWPDDRPVWTGSCPCQPFSVAGKGAGIDDARHLWPTFAELIRERSPGVVFGEQVAGAAGGAWLDGVHADMEAMGYAFGAASLCAAGAGAPHARQRLYWIAAHAGSVGASGRVEAGRSREVRPGGAPRPVDLREVCNGPYVAGTGHPQPLLRPSHDGVSGRVGRLRGYGNAIDPHLAAMFIAAAT